MEYQQVSSHRPHSQRRPQRPKPVSFLQGMLFGFGRPFLNKEAQVNEAKLVWSTQ